jgi:hypothetical protein
VYYDTIEQQFFSQIPIDEIGITCHQRGLGFTQRITMPSVKWRG